MTDSGEMMNSFRNAANSVAILYKDSVVNGKRAYEAGYNQALQDLWTLKDTSCTIGEDTYVPLSCIIQFLESKKQGQKQEQPLPPALVVEATVPHAFKYEPLETPKRAGMLLDNIFNPFEMDMFEQHQRKRPRRDDMSE